MHKLFMIVITVFIMFSMIHANQNIQFPRTPAPSPSGDRVAFSFQGDIWSVPVSGGTAVRITAHPAYDHMPQWSPNGSQIACTSRGRSSAWCHP